MSSDRHVKFFVGNVGVFFPYEPYATQRDYVECVVKALSQGHHAILESPTGTGKTLSLLCSSLAWLQNQGGAAKTIIYYTSRTHMQLAQAAKEMKRTAYAKNPAVVIGSRAQMCLNDEVRQQSGDHLINRACRNAIAKNACSYHTNYEKKLEVMDINSVQDIEDLCQFGRTHQCCPYYASKKIAESKATVVFMPYNYLLDTSLRRSVQLKLENSVIIFDEAHNIEGVLKDSVSGFFSQSCLQTVQDSCLKLPEKIHEALNKEKHGFSRFGYDPKDKGVVDEFAKQKGSKSDKEPKVNPIEELAEKLTNDKLQQVNRCAEILKRETTTMLKLESTNTVDKIYHLMNAANVVFSTSSHIITTLDSMASFWSIAGVMNPALVAKYVSAITNLCQVISLLYPEDCLSQIRQSNHEKRVLEFYITHLKGIYDSSVVLRKGDLKDWQLDLWCLHPAIGLKRVIDSNCIRGPRSLIVTSGTLAPMRAIEKELETEFKTIREFKHIIGDNQLKIMVVGKSPDDYSLESHFEATKKDDYFKALGKTLAPMFQVLPYGTLVFFQSYNLLNRAIKFWKDKSTIWKDMNSASSVYVESQQQSNFLGDISTFKRKLDAQGSRAVFFGVCRGKLSEGVNLEGNHCRTVILTGLPFPSLMDPKVVATRNFHSKKGDIGGSLWYSQQMTRALNQTIGRVIRSKSDFGMLLLCDPRFSGYKYSLSEWTRKYFPSGPTPIGEVELATKAFFHEHGITITQTASQDAGAFEIGLSKRPNLLTTMINGSPFSEASSKSSQDSNRSTRISLPPQVPVSAKDRQAAMIAGYTVDKRTFERVKSSRVQINEEELMQATRSKRPKTTTDIFESVCAQSKESPLASPIPESNRPESSNVCMTNGSSSRLKPPNTLKSQVNGSGRLQNGNQRGSTADSDEVTVVNVPKPPPRSLNIFKKKARPPNRENTKQTQSTDTTGLVDCFD